MCQEDRTYVYVRKIRTDEYMLFKCGKQNVTGGMEGCVRLWRDIVCGLKWDNMVWEGCGNITTLSRSPTSLYRQNIYPKIFIKYVQGAGIPGGPYLGAWG